MAEWYRASTEETLQEPGSDARQGLSNAQACHLLSEQGPNELVERAAKSPWRMLLAQFTEAVELEAIVAPTKGKESRTMIKSIRADQPHF